MGPQLSLPISPLLPLTHCQPGGPDGAPEEEVGDVPLVLAGVLVRGEDVSHACRPDQRNTLVTRALGDEEQEPLSGAHLPAPGGPTHMNEYTWSSVLLSGGGLNVVLT